MKPKDQRVGMNGIATFECHASGNPPPSVFWTKEGSQELMFAGTTHGQMFVTEDGTLTIQVNTCTMWQQYVEGQMKYSESLHNTIFGTGEEVALSEFCTI